VGSAAVILVAMVVMMVAIETMLVVMMMIMVMVLGTLTQVPFHHDLGTLKVLLALSIPAPPTIHKHPLFGLIFPAGSRCNL
jgi:hypothetical protein